MRSGVNCTRLKSRSSVAASVLTSSVLATPGTPSNSTWPRTSRATTSPVRTPSWPTTAFVTSSRTARTASRGSRSRARARLVLAGTGDLLADGLHGLGQGDERGLVGRRRAVQEGDDDVGRATGARRDRAGQLVGRRVHGGAQPLGQRAPEVVAQHA